MVHLVLGADSCLTHFGFYNLTVIQRSSSVGENIQILRVSAILKGINILFDHLFYLIWRRRTLIWLFVQCRSSFWKLSWIIFHTGITFHLRPCSDDLISVAESLCLEKIWDHYCLWVSPDHSWCVPEDGGGEALRDTHQTRPVHLHDLVIHLDPDKHTHKWKVNTSHNNPVQVLLSWFQPRKTQNKMLLWLNMHKGQTNWPIINIHIILQITHRKKCQTVLWSQISTVVAPDYYLTERQKRWGSKQTRRANEDKASSSLGHNTAGISALVTTGGQLSSGPQIKVMMIHCSGLGWTVWTGKCTRLIFNLNPLRNLHKKQTERNYKSEFWIICWTYE